MNQPSAESWFYCPPWSAISVSGPEAASFLHNLCTNDIKSLEAGQACESLFTDVKAHVLAHAIVFGAGEEYQVVVTSPHAPDLFAHLDRYHIREKLELRLVEQPAVTLVNNQSKAAVDFPDFSWQSLKSLDGGVAVSLGDEAESRESLQASDWHEAGPALFDSMRLVKRFPLDRIDVDQRNLPQELNRDAALINFNKGCYLGQETVARIDALGRVNQLLMIVRCQSLPKTDGRELSADGKVIGRLTSYSEEPDGGSAVGLAYVRREHATPGATLMMQSGKEVTVIE